MYYKREELTIQIRLVVGSTSTTVVDYLAARVIYKIRHVQCFAISNLQPESYGLEKRR